MRENKQLEKALEIALGKMFKMVGAKYTPEYTEVPDWFMNYEWTTKQQIEYIEWLSKKMISRWGVMQHIMNYPSKLNVKRCAEEFTYNYGWKTKE